MNPAPPAARPGRRRALAVFVNTALALMGGGLTALLGAFAVRPGGASTAADRWMAAGNTSDLTPDVPVPRVLTVSRVDGWYRERARQTVFLVWDGARTVRAMSATCTHLGCQVRWQAEARQFRCPCHGGVFDPGGRVLEGPPPRPLDTLEARVEADGAVMVRL